MQITALSNRPGDVRVGPEAQTEPPRRLPTWLRVALAVPMMLLAALAQLPIVMIPGVGEWADGLPPLLGAAVVWVLNGLSVLMAWLLVWLAMRYLDRRPFSDVGWTWNARSLPAFGLGLAITVAVVVAAGLLVQLTGTLRPYDPIEGRPVLLVVLVLLAQAFFLQGIPEEIIWRGYVLQTLQTRPVVSVVISAAVFAVCHIISIGGQEGVWERFAYLLIPFGFALLAGALVLRTGSLWSAIGVHSGFHVGTLIGAVGLGVGNGPLLWTVQGVVLGLIAVVLLRRLPDRDRATV